MTPSPRRLLVFLILVLTTGFYLSEALSQVEEQPPGIAQTAPGEPGMQRLTLTEATMCEKVENLTPSRGGIVFSVSAGQVCCFTAFDPVPQPTLVYHRWYHHDELSTQTRLRLYPPKWATYSVIQLRETDKGPWRVEVTDQNGHVFEVLRFSITD